MISDEMVIKIARAIAYAEGHGKPDALPTRCNNPGDLSEGDRGYGTARSTGIGATEITIFATEAEGWMALYQQVRRMFSGKSPNYHLDMTIDEVGMKYAEVHEWGVNVAEHLAAALEVPITPQTTLRDLEILNGEA